MGKKRYITESLRYSISIDIDGKKDNIEFIGVSSHKNGSAFITDDKKVQEAIEKTPAFNTRVFVDTAFNPQDLEEIKHLLNNPVGSAKPVLPTENKSGLEIMEFMTVNEAKDFFVKNHGLLVSKLQTKAQIKAEGKALGFEVKFSND